MPRKPKQPKFAANPYPVKTPKVISAPPRFQGTILAWRFNAADQSGPFAWSSIADGETYRTVIEKLIGFETMSETDLGAAGCHAIPLGRLSSEAQRRLTEIQLDDLDDLYSFRIKGKMRVFGVVRSNYVRVLWFDPDHKVCPSKKKNT